MGSATQAPFISCSEVHNIKGHALMIRYPGNSKARRENYTYPTSNILAKMKMISVKLGWEITLWIYQCVGVQFFFRLSEWICAFGGGDVNIKGIKGLCVTSVFPKKAARVGGWQSVRPRHHCVDVPGASAGVTAQCGPPLSGENWNSAAAESKLHSRIKKKKRICVTVDVFSYFFLTTIGRILKWMDRELKRSLSLCLVSHPL